jgi:hypothetical protein
MCDLPAALGGNKGTKRFTNAVNQLEQMRQYALNPDKLCRHAQVRGGLLGNVCMWHL